MPRRPREPSYVQDSDEESESRSRSATHASMPGGIRPAPFLPPAPYNEAAAPQPRLWIEQPARDQPPDVQLPPRPAPDYGPFNPAMPFRATDPRVTHPHLFNPDGSINQEYVGRRPVGRPRVVKEEVKPEFGVPQAVPTSDGRLRSACWVVTIHDPRRLWPVPSRVPDGMSYLVGQYERARDEGDEPEGRPHIPHWQLYVEFDKRITRDRVRAALGVAGELPEGVACWCEKRLGSQRQAINYVTKEETRVAGVPRIELGTPHPPDAKEKWNDAVAAAAGGAAMDTIREQFPATAARCPGLLNIAMYAQRRMTQGVKRDVKTYVFIGPTGGGKTHAVNEAATQAAHGDYEAGQKMLFRKPKNRFWDFYDGQPIVYYDEVEPNPGYLPLPELLTYIDVYPVDVDAKHSMRNLNAIKTVYLTSNFHPIEWYPTGDPVHMEALRRRITQIFFVDKVVEDDKTEYRVRPMGWDEAYEELMTHRLVVTHKRAAELEAARERAQRRAAEQIAAMRRK